MQMLDRMQRGGLTPTAFHFGCAVDACGRGGEVKRVLDLLREMQATARVRGRGRVRARVRARARERLARACCLIGLGLGLGRG